MASYAFFSSCLDSLVKTKNNKAFLVAARKLEKTIISQGGPAFAYRLALELDFRGFKTSKLEAFIISYGDLKYIFRFAKEIRKANITKLQNAIVNRGVPLYIAKFGCFVRGANKSLLENIIVKLQHPKSAYYYLKYVRFCNVNKLKPIILQSKRPRYLFTLAKLLKNKKELNLIQDLIINSTSNTYVRLFAAQINGADIKRLEARIIATKDAEEMKKFSKVVDSPRIAKLISLF